MDNSHYWTPLKGMAMPVILTIMAWLSNIPFIGVATFLSIILNGLYIRYKWRKSEEFNKIGLKKAALELQIKEEELRQLKDKA